MISFRLTVEATKIREVMSRKRHFADFCAGFARSDSMKRITIGFNDNFRMVIIDEGQISRPCLGLRDLA
jgi:hypothetical protein